MLGKVIKPFVCSNGRQAVVRIVNRKVHSIPEVRGNVHSIETFSAIDGPGIRMMIFLQGCYLRCKFCSNPDTWKIEKNTNTSSKEIAEKITRIYPYLRNNSSGVTCSGGEPLLQSEFVSAIFQEAKSMNLTTCLDTAGQAPVRNQLQVLPHTDLVLVCIKHMNIEKYKELTGVYPYLVFKFLDTLVKMEKPFYIRYVLVPGYTDGDDDLDELVKLTKSVGPTCKGIELLPYHTLGLNKWVSMNLKYPLEGIKPCTKEHINDVCERLRNENIAVLI